MSRRTTGTNAFETTCSTTGASDATITLTTTTNLVAPGYVTIDPFNASSREVIRYETINGNVLENLTRGLAGSAGGVAQAHLAGARVISTPTEQVFNDIFTDIEDLEAADADLVRKDGSTPFTAPQTGVAGTGATDLATKSQVDTVDTIANQGVADAATAQAAADAAQADIDAFSAANSVIVEGETTPTLAVVSGFGEKTIDTIAITIPAEWNTYDVHLSWTGTVIAEAPGGIFTDQLIKIRLKRSTTVLAEIERKVEFTAGDASPPWTPSAMAISAFEETQSATGVVTYTLTIEQELDAAWSVGANAGGKLLVAAYRLT